MARRTAVWSFCAFTLFGAACSAGVTESGEVTEPAGDAGSPAAELEPTAPVMSTEDPELGAESSGLDLSPPTNVVAWSEAGVIVYDDEGDATAITEEPTQHALLFDDGVVAYQSDDAKIVVVDAGDNRVIEAEPGFSIQLLDGAIIDGQSKLLVATRLLQPEAPHLTEGRLLEVDVSSGDRSSLAWIDGGSSIGAGRYVGAFVATLESFETTNVLVVRSPEARWSRVLPLQSDTSYAMAVIPGGQEIALVRPSFEGAGLIPGIGVTVVNALSGETSVEVRSSLEEINVDLQTGFCLTAEYSATGSLYCDQSNGAPLEIQPGGAWRTERVSGVDSGAIAPVITDLGVSSTLVHIGQSPDGRFRYVMDAAIRDPQPILVDGGDGLRPAMNDDRAQFRLGFDPNRWIELSFLDRTTVTWTNVATSSMQRAMIGRIDETGMIVDVVERDRQQGSAEVLRDFDVMAVMSSGVDLEIDAVAPLVGLISEPDEPFDGAWYSGKTLALAPACGGETLYRTTADGYGRVLPANWELDSVVTAHETVTHSGANHDSAWIERHLALATECGDKYEGIRLHVVTEFLGFGDGGPRSVPGIWRWLDSYVTLSDGTSEFEGVADIQVIGLGCDQRAVVVVDLVGLDGVPITVQIERAAFEQPLAITAVSPETSGGPEVSLCEELD